MADIIEDIDILGKEELQPSEEIKVTRDQHSGKKKKLYIESYGCQMNFSDSEIVASILHDQGFDTTSNPTLCNCSSALLDV